MQELNSGNVVPAARVSDLVINDIHGEVLVYDTRCHHIHHLNATAAAVWRHCDGARTVSDLAAWASINEEAVRLALRILEDARLLDGPLSAEMRDTRSRRAFLRKAAVVGAVALPTIISISAPTAAAASSHPLTATGGSCTSNSDCASGMCLALVCT